MYKTVILCCISLVIGDFVFEALSGRNNWVEAASIGFIQVSAIWTAVLLVKFSEK